MLFTKTLFIQEKKQVIYLTETHLPAERMGKEMNGGCTQSCHFGKNQVGFPSICMFGALERSKCRLSYTAKVYIILLILLLDYLPVITQWCKLDNLRSAVGYWEIISLCKAQ